MNVLLCFNNNFVRLARSLIISLMCHHADLHIIVAYLHLDEEQRQSLKQLVESPAANAPWNSGLYAKKEPPKHRISFVQADESLIPDMPFKKKFSADIWSRCFIWDRFDFSRLLYLDADIIVNGNIESFYNADLRETPIMAAPDLSITYKTMEYLAPLHLNDNPAKPYFNSGVMLFDLDNMRSQGHTVAKMQDFLKTCPTLRYPDQDFLNLYFKNNYAPANPFYYNCLVYSISKFGRRLLRDFHEVQFAAAAPSGSQNDLQPLIIHYNGKKPFKWNYNQKHFAREYWHYALMDPLCGGAHALLRASQASMRVINALLYPFNMLLNPLTNHIPYKPKAD